MSISSTRYQSYGTFGDVEKCFTHIVREGETLVSLSVRFGVDTKAIIDRNKDHLDPTRLTVGDTILIPRGVTEESLHKIRAEEEEKEEKEEGGPKVTRRVHIVAEGETLDFIASLYNTEPSEIRRLNRNIFPVGERVDIRPGMNLAVIAR